MPRAQTDLAAMVAFRSVADAKVEPPEECAKCADWVARAFAEAGIDQVEQHETPDGSRAIVGHTPGPPGTPTVLLYSHYDVQPAGDPQAWTDDPWTLTERGGRWYGRGAADCKGNIAMHLAALRALGGGDFPVSVKIVVEGSEEQGTGGLERFVPANADLLRADAILVVDTGNFAVGVPTVTTSLRGMANVKVTVEALRSEMHSGMFGGPAPDALAALIHMLSTLRDDDGNTTVQGLDNTQAWPGVEYTAEQFRTDATVLPGVDVIGGAPPSAMLWARPAATVLGIDVPSVDQSAASIQARSRARINLRVPPGLDAHAAQDALVAHLEAVAPWNVQVSCEREEPGQPFSADTSGPAYAALGEAMEAAYGKELTSEGQGGSIPLCNVLRTTYPEAEIVLMGVEEPLCLIHAPDESVDPTEIEHIALAEALFLQRYAAARGAS
jgi:acetylornithine deacetylase/succinyl-diaminopimelate desuccinylase-like protein